MQKRVIVVAIAILAVIGGGSAALAYLAVANKTVYTDMAQLQAPVVALASTVPGKLEHVYVTPGQVIQPNTVVAQVGLELITSTQGGLVLTAPTDVGSLIPGGQPVVTTIDPRTLRVVGQVDEDKGLADIKVGAPARFTVDTFGSTVFDGVVDEVSPSAHAGDIVFNISDQRQVQSFDVKVRFDTRAHPELKNGMSAKLWIYKQ
jgi:multidrug resistance efflux pump